MKKLFLLLLVLTSLSLSRSMASWKLEMVEKVKDCKVYGYNVQQFDGVKFAEIALLCPVVFKDGH
jgi:hypothetical protein